MKPLTNNDRIDNEDEEIEDQLEFKKFKKGDEDEEIEDQLDFKKIKKGYY